MSIQQGVTKGALMDESQLSYTEAELLADDDIAEPLFAGGVRCHGGFDDDGTYVSPRTRFRRPAISAWGRHHCNNFSTSLLDVPLERWTRTIPNVAQARHLISFGVPEPLIASLTRIGMAEGLGAKIRLFKPDNMQRYFHEDIRGTAVDHLGKGLFEAHGRDEAGWEEEAGHQDMWFAARDIAFEQSATLSGFEDMLGRMGILRTAGGSVPKRVLPGDIPVELELMVALMIRVLFIELSAYHTFAWAESWMSDPDLVAGGGEAARLISYIRTDEAPHVDYLRTALTEMRDRTWIGESGRKYAGAELLARIWDPLLSQSIQSAREDTPRAVLDEVEYWCSQHRQGTDILTEFHALSTP